MRNTFAASSGITCRLRRMDRNRGDETRNRLEMDVRTEEVPPSVIVDDDGGVSGSAGDVGRGGRGSDDERGGAFAVDAAPDACSSSSCSSMRALPYEWNRLMICSTELAISSPPLLTTPQLLSTPLLLPPLLLPLPVAASAVPGDGALAPRTADISWLAGRGNTSGVNWGWIQW